MLRDVEHVKANSPEDFATEYRKVCRKINLIGEVIDHYIISPVEAHIFYQFQSETQEEKTRYCCECGHFMWSRRCPFKEGKVVNRKDTACDKISVEVSA